MEPETTTRQPRTLRKIAIHALTGAIIGLLFALIPLSFAWGSDSFQAIHIILSIGFVAFCGILSAISGEKYIDRLNAFKKTLENRQFPNLNGLTYLTSAALADYPTTTYQSQSTTTQFIDLEQKSLPRSLQQSIATWEFLSHY